MISVEEQKCRKFRLMKAALRRIGCDMLYLQKSNLSGRRYVLAAFSCNGNYSYPFTKTRLFIDAGYGISALSNVLLEDIDIEFVRHPDGHGMIHPDDYCIVFDRLVAMKRKICTARGKILLAGTDDDFYKLEIEADLQGDDI